MNPELLLPAYLKPQDSENEEDEACGHVPDGARAGCVEGHTLIENLGQILEDDFCNGETGSAGASQDRLEKMATP